MNNVINKYVEVQELGLIDFKEAWDYQTKLFNEVVNIKISNRKLPIQNQQITPNYILFCQHPHVYTLGKSGVREHMLLSEEQLDKLNAVFYKINRGGDITYHGPGQLVGYPILDLDNFFSDIHKYLRLLEEAVIRTLSEYNIKSGRIEGLTGVWLDFEKQNNPRKICALGVKSSRWVTMHGFALNVNTDLNYFRNIVPCGIEDKAVTSMAKELSRTILIEEVQRILTRNIMDLFEMQLVDSKHEERY